MEPAIQPAAHAVATLPPASQRGATPPASPPEAATRVVTIPPPPPRAPGTPDAGGVLALLLPAQPAVPSALDVDPAHLAPTAGERPPSARQERRGIPFVGDDDAELQAERVRLLAAGVAAAVLAAVFAGAVALAL